MEQEKTNSYTYFSIGSNGELKKKEWYYTFVANEGSDFDPAYITKLLGIQPIDSWMKGDPWNKKHPRHFSSWHAERSEKDRLDGEAQCLDTIKNLKHKIPELMQIKEQYDVGFTLFIVPKIHNGETPYLKFNKEIMEFCYLADVDIGVDMYIISGENDEAHKGEEEVTHCYTYFEIGSVGSSATNEKGAFDPDDMTELLGIQPFDNYMKGDPCEEGYLCRSSSWRAEKSDAGRWDAKAQCVETIKNLKYKISELKQIKEQYDVNYVIHIVPWVYQGEQPCISLDKEIIEFCYLADVEIVVDITIISGEEAWADEDYYKGLDAHNAHAKSYDTL